MTEQDDIFRKFAEAEKRAGQNVDPKDLLTKQEIHEFLCRCWNPFQQLEANLIF